MQALLAYFLLLLVAGVVTALKGKWGVFALGLLVGPAWLLGAFRLAKPDSWWARRFYPPETRERARLELPRRVLLARLGAIPALALLAAAFATVKLYRIPTAAMEPALHCSRPGVGCLADEADRVVSVRFLADREPTRGDIVAFRVPLAAAARCGVPPDAVFVDRVLGLPGERIEQRDGVIRIDGSPISALYAPRARPGGADFGARRIPAGQYFVVGDNRAQSCDSRVWGTLPGDRLIAQVVGIYWPPVRVGSL